MNIVEQVRAAGVVGAGGAGFPTHVKLGGKAGVVIANGAECEPLLRVDQLLMRAGRRAWCAAWSCAWKRPGPRVALSLQRRITGRLWRHCARQLGEGRTHLALMESYYPPGMRIHHL